MRARVVWYQNAAMRERRHDPEVRASEVTLCACREKCLHVSIACPCCSYQNAAMRERRKDPEVRQSEVCVHERERELVPLMHAYFA